jgi:hypothetical protein
MRESYARPGVLTTPTAAMAADCKTQRSRWAGGAAQIAKKHWRQFLPGTSLLDHDQKREFAFGWLAVRCFQDRRHPGSTAHPADLQCIPRVARPLCLFILVARRCSYWQMLSAMVVFMSVQWTVASAAFQAVLPAN